MVSLTITYGQKGGPRSGHIRDGRRGVADPSFTVTPGKTPGIRLNTDLGLRFQSDQLAKLPGNQEKLDYLKYEVLGALDLFAQYQRTFVDRYFAFIPQRCREVHEELVAALAWSEGLFTPDDYVFSAFWPLPDAQIVQQTAAGEIPVGAFDFAFWTGQRAVGITLLGGVSDQTDPMEELRNPGPETVLPVTIYAGDFHNDTPLFSAPRFPEEIESFWIGEPVPCSPFRPFGLVDDTSQSPALGEDQ